VNYVFESVLTNHDPMQRPSKENLYLAWKLQLPKNPPHTTHGSWQKNQQEKAEPPEHQKSDTIHV
jgi:hypothetical protein